jgi:hypothetical protein
MDEDEASCELCRVAAGENEPPEGWLIRNDLVTAYISAGNSEVPGWCQLQVNRHVPTLAGLSPSESAAIGLAAQQLAAAGLAATGIEDQRVYLYSLCEFVPHFHLVLGPAPVVAPGEPRGGALLSRILSRDETVRDASTAAEVAGRLRAKLPTI